MEKFIEKNCKTHGLTMFVWEKRGAYRCKQCRVDAVTKRRKKVKAMGVEYLGGGCHVCQYSKCQDALDFHHINPEDKSFGIASKGVTLGWDVIKEELDKCVLLCANCHREHHAGLITIGQ